MPDDTLQKFDTLRSQILNELVPLVEHTSGDVAQKYNLLLAIARSSSDPERFAQAFETAKSLESADDKAAAFLDLLDAMEDATTALRYPGDAESPASEPPIAEGAPHNDQPQE